jgi:hypothetical protein
MGTRRAEEISIINNNRVLCKKKHYEPKTFVMMPIKPYALTLFNM